jgi:predicted PurR-regulated permease PerM
MINDNLISPRVMASNVELFPGLILVVIFIGAAIGGIFGMLCAVPITAAAKQIFVFYFEKRTGRQLVSDKGALFRGHPSKQDDPASDATDGQLTEAEIEDIT